MEVFPVHLIDEDAIALLADLLLQLEQGSLQLAVTQLGLPEPSLQLADQVQQVPLLPAQLLVHLVVAILSTRPQPPLVDLSLLKVKLCTNKQSAMG